MINKKQIQEIVDGVVEEFATFGGNKTDRTNPISIVMEGKPPIFAANVSVEQVVKHVVTKHNKNVKQWVKKKYGFRKK